MADILYANMALHHWSDCDTWLPVRTFVGLDDGSVGFLAVYDDVEKLKAANPGGAEIMKIERIAAQRYRSVYEEIGIIRIAYIIPMDQSKKEVII
mgnify:CR=1 FL=1